MVILPPRSSLGEVIGQSLSDVASHWAQHTSTTNALKQLGFSDAQARAYSHLGPQAQQQAIHAQQQRQAQEREANVTQMLLNKGIGGMQPSMNASAQAQPQATPYQGIPKPQLPHEQQQAAIQQATSIAQNPNFRKLNEQQQQAQALQNQQLMQKPAAAQQTGEQQAILQAQAQEAQKEPPFKARLEDVATRRRALISAPISPTQKKEVHKILKDEEDAIREEMKESRQDQKEIDAETLPYYRSVKEKSKAAKESNVRLDRMLQLIKGGNLDSKYKVMVADAFDSLPFGIGKLWSAVIKSTYHPDTEEFEKLSKDFLKGAKAFFGTRMTEAEAFAILQTVPSLLTTDLGKQRVSRNMKILNEVEKLTNETMETVIAENGGRRPRDLERQVEIRIGSQVDQLYEKFRNGWWDEEFRKPGASKSQKPQKEYLIKGVRL